MIEDFAGVEKPGGCNGTGSFFVQRGGDMLHKRACGHIFCGQDKSFAGDRAFHESDHKPGHIANIDEAIFSRGVKGGVMPGEVKNFEGFAEPVTSAEDDGRIDDSDVESFGESSPGFQFGQVFTEGVGGAFFFPFPGGMFIGKKMFGWISDSGGIAGKDEFTDISFEGFVDEVGGALNVYLEELLFSLRMVGYHPSAVVNQFNTLQGIL